MKLIDKSLNLGIIGNFEVSIFNPIPFFILHNILFKILVNLPNIFPFLYGLVMLRQFFKTPLRDITDSFWLYEQISLIRVYLMGHFIIPDDCRLAISLLIFVPVVKKGAIIVIKKVELFLGVLERFAHFHYFSFSTDFVVDFLLNCFHCHFFMLKSDHFTRLGLC